MPNKENISKYDDVEKIISLYSDLRENYKFDFNL